jgi:hypothetical protein
VLDAGRRSGIVAHHQGGVHPVATPQQLDDAPGVLLVHGDHQATGVGLHRPDGLELHVGLVEHGRQPLARQRQGGAQALT